jgi:hypothetical protein
MFSFGIKHKILESFVKKINLFNLYDFFKVFLIKRTEKNIKLIRYKFEPFNHKLMTKIDISLHAAATTSYPDPLCICLI